MIISQTPLRVSIVGGGTDLKNFYNKNKGQVISFSINKFIYVIVKKTPNYIDCIIMLTLLHQEVG